MQNELFSYNEDANYLKIIKFFNLRHIKYLAFNKLQTDNDLLLQLNDI